MKQCACLAGLLCGYLTGRVAKTVFYSGEDLTFLRDLGPQRGVSDFEAASRRSLALVIVFQRATQLCLERFDLLGQ